MKTVWSEQASKTLRGIAAYVHSKFGLHARQELLQEVARTSQLLEQTPYIGRVEPLLEGCEVEYRSLVINKLNKIVYYVSGDAVEIVAIWDTRREPRYLTEQLTVEN